MVIKTYIILTRRCIKMIYFDKLWRVKMILTNSLLFCIYTLFLIFIPLEFNYLSICMVIIGGTLSVYKAYVIDMSLYFCVHHIIFHVGTYLMIMDGTACHFTIKLGLMLYSFMRISKRFTPTPIWICIYIFVEYIASIIMIYEAINYKGKLGVGLVIFSQVESFNSISKFNNVKSIDFAIEGNLLYKNLDNMILLMTVIILKYPSYIIIIPLGYILNKWFKDITYPIIQYVIIFSHSIINGHSLGYLIFIYIIFILGSGKTSNVHGSLLLAYCIYNFV